jgi:hypothetical protein
VSGYLDPEGTEEFFDFLCDLENTRFDTTTELYSKIIELRNESFIYFPGVALITNHLTLGGIIKKLHKLNLVGEIECDCSEIYNPIETFNCTIKNLKQQEQ